VFDIDYAATNAWDNFQLAMPVNQPTLLRAVYEIVPDASTESNGIWTGRIVSAPLKVTIHPR
jgi:hypothetical protein